MYVCMYVHMTMHTHLATPIHVYVTMEIAPTRMHACYRLAASDLPIRRDSNAIDCSASFDLHARCLIMLMILPLPTLPQNCT